MAKLPILIAPNPILKKVATPVDDVNDDIRTLLDDMMETMYAAPGIGLAAPQVGVSVRVLVIDISPTGDAPTPLKIINPEIIDKSADINKYEEGCLSFPDQYAEVKRPSEVVVSYLNELGEKCEISADGLFATCIQHEIDHLNGIVFVDHVSTMKRGMIMRKLKKQQKLND